MAMVVESRSRQLSEPSPRDGALLTSVSAPLRVTGFDQFLSFLAFYVWFWPAIAFGRLVCFLFDACPAWPN